MNHQEPGLTKGMKIPTHYYPLPQGEGKGEGGVIW